MLVIAPFSLDGCETIGALIEMLTNMAYGVYGNEREVHPDNNCPGGLVCAWPSCRYLQDNGSFEVPERFLVPAEGWSGDLANTANTSCYGLNSLAFEGTTPEGPSESTSSQVYQVIDYRTVIPEELQDTMRRVRVHAAFQVFLPFSDDDLEFGITIDAYAGMAGAFPTSGDPEDIPESGSGYNRIDSQPERMLYDEDRAGWQPLDVEYWLPDGTDFFVVLLEANENVFNETVDEEFGVHFVDDVRIAVDGGNTPPIAVPDAAKTNQGTAVVIPVLANDFDRTSALDSGSVQITQPSAFGSAVVASNGDVTFTPSGNFIGTASFAYTGADVEGLVSNEAQVTVTVLGSAYDLVLDKTASASTVTHSGQVTFIVDVANVGPSPAADIRVVDRLPSFNFSGQNTTVTQGNFSFNDDGTTETTTWDVGSLDSGESATLRITGLAHVTLTNTAEITSGLEEDIDASNNSDQFTVTVGG